MINLKTIEIVDIEGKKKSVEFGYKSLANLIYNQTRDIGELELARELYKTGKVKLNKETATCLKRYIQEGFPAITYEALFPILDKHINE